MPLPRNLTALHVQTAVEHIEREAADLVDLYLEQANVFSAIVGIFGTRALARRQSLQEAQASRHRSTTLPRPVLGGPIEPSPLTCSGVKGSTRPWAIQSHYNHPGWYVVWRYLVDTTQSIKPGHPVVIWRVDVVFLTTENWKYETSKAAEGKGGRTHTFGVREAAKTLRGAAAYLLPGIVIRGGKPTLGD